MDERLGFVVRGLGKGRRSSATAAPHRANLKTRRIGAEAGPPTLLQTVLRKTCACCEKGSKAGSRDSVPRSFGSQVEMPEVSTAAGGNGAAMVADVDVAEAVEGALKSLPWRPHRAYMG